MMKRRKKIWKAKDEKIRAREDVKREEVKIRKGPRNTVSSC
jgi:hypothetical protein